MKVSERKKFIEAEQASAAGRAALLNELRMVEALLEGRPNRISLTVENSGQSPVEIGMVFNFFQASGTVHEMRRECLGSALLEVLRGYQSDLCDVLKIESDAEPDEDMGPIRVEPVPADLMKDDE